MSRLFISIAICSAALASCSKDEERARRNISDGELAGFKVGTSDTLQVLEASPPDWLLPVPTCPADSLPEHFQESTFDLEACAGSAVTRCLEECQGNKASACYASALVLQHAERPEDQNIATALFARACQLGDASGCTNWGAALDEEIHADCVHRSFAATCLRGHDPWGCTMYARALVAASNGEVAIETVKPLLVDACRFGQDDPACEALQTIIASLEESL